MPSKEYSPITNDEAELMIALMEWRNAGAPVGDVMQTLRGFVDERVRLQLAGGRSDDA